MEFSGLLLGCANEVIRHKYSVVFSVDSAVYMQSLMSHMQSNFKLGKSYLYCHVVMLLWILFEIHYQLNMVVVDLLLARSNCTM